jgi:TolB-like protein
MEKREAARSTHTRSIAVLPFKPINAASSDDHLGLGMTGATINRLGAQRQFSVQPASAVFKYTDRADDSLTIGRGLGVDAVLEGTVQRSGDDVRVTVQLINVSDGQTLWSQKFDARFTTMHAVQDEISEQVADSLQLELTSRDKKQLARSDTENPQGKL